MTTAVSIRNILFKKSASLPATVAIKCNTPVVSFQDNVTYKKQPPKRQRAVDITVDFGKVSGLDAAGAETAEIISSFHSGGEGTDKFSRLTAIIKNKAGTKLYFYRKTDKTYWEHIHIPESKTDPAWPHQPIYVCIKPMEYHAKRLITTQF